MSILYYIILTFFSLFSYIIFKNRKNISIGYKMYTGYKRLIDPENKLGHIHTIKSIGGMIMGKPPVLGPSLDKDKDKPVSQPETFNKKYLKISYKYKDKDYFYLLKIPKGVAPLQKIEDENGEDIEETLMPYLGPNLDCHGTSVKPSDFGYTKVVVTTIFDSVVTFEENDPIILTI